MPVDPSRAGAELPESTFEYSDRDVILYAMGIGATSQELDFVYEKALKVFPTFAVVPAFPMMMGLGRVLEFNPWAALHGDQRIELRAPIPTSGKLTTKGRVASVYDKGSGALAIIASETKDASGTVLFANTTGVFLRGEGGFGGDRGPSASGKNIPPERKPDHRVEYKTAIDQAALYRLSGDRNPLHIDPEIAKLGGFERPILHGLCTFGYVGRAVLHSVCAGDPVRLKDFEARFSGVVFPGETIVTDIWQESSSQYLVQASTAERGEPVISNAAATLA